MNTSLQAWFDNFFCNLQFIDVGTMVSPTVFARRSLSFLMTDMPQEALSDAMQAQVISPVWHVASYLQAVALAALGMENEARLALKEGTDLEADRNATTGQKWQCKMQNNRRVYISCSGGQCPIYENDHVALIMAFSIHGHGEQWKLHSIL